MKTLKVDKLPTIRRLPSYLHVLRNLSRIGSTYVSSGLLGNLLGIDAVLVRKDLELTGIPGTPRIGYSITDLTRAIEEFLGWTDNQDAFLIGVGNLGSALLGYAELETSGFKVVAAFDNHPEKIGTTVHGVPVFCISKIPDLLKRMNVRVAILTMPAEDSQSIADLLVQHGIRGIWNFTNVSLEVPPDVVTHKEDILSGLAVLSTKMARNCVAGGCAEEGCDEGED